MNKSLNESQSIVTRVWGNWIQSGFTLRALISSSSSKATLYINNGIEGILYDTNGNQI